MAKSPQKQPRRSTGRGPRGRRGAKGAPGAWPTEPFDFLLAKINYLQERFDDLSHQVAELEEKKPKPR